MWPAPATPDARAKRRSEAKGEEMTVGQERLAFLVLVGAFAVSALYQLYRAALMEVDPTE